MFNTVKTEMKLNSFFCVCVCVFFLGGRVGVHLSGVSGHAEIFAKKCVLQGFV